MLTGKDKGKTGEVIRVMPKENRARGARRQRRSRGISARRRRSRAASSPRRLPIHLSNVALADNDGKPTRVGFRIDKDGNKVRFAKRSGDVIDG